MKKLLLILLCLPMIGFGQVWTYGFPESDALYEVHQNAVRKGFEPPKQFPVYTLSKRAP